MKTSSFFFGILWLLVWGGAEQSILAAPRLEVVGGPTFDFGEVQANQSLTHTFVLKNTGDSVLRIEQAKGG